MTELAWFILLIPCSHKLAASTTVFFFSFAYTTSPAAVMTLMVFSLRWNSCQECVRNVQSVNCAGWDLPGLDAELAYNKRSQQIACHSLIMNVAGMPFHTSSDFRISGCFSNKLKRKMVHSIVSSPCWVFNNAQTGASCLQQVTVVHIICLVSSSAVLPHPYGFQQTYVRVRKEPVISKQYQVRSSLV